MRVVSIKKVKLNKAIKEIRLANNSIPTKEERTDFSNSTVIFRQRRFRDKQAKAQNYRLSQEPSAWNGPNNQQHYLNLKSMQN